MLPSSYVYIRLVVDMLRWYPGTWQADFLARVAAYQERYQPLGQAEEDEGVRFIKMFNVGRKMTTHLCTGFGFFFCDGHVACRRPIIIFLSRFDLNEQLPGWSNLHVFIKLPRGSPAIVSLSPRPVAG